MIDQTFRSLDRHTSEHGKYWRSDRYRDLFDALNATDIIPRGAGLSYVAASFGADATSIDMSSFDRILDFDSEALEIEVEPGCSLGKLFEFLTPRGLMLPVQPGYPSITVGGCVAGDVHGKNHYQEGTFRRWVVALTLHHPDHGTLRCSSAEEPELFDLTCGGFGLTGMILAVRLKLQTLPGAEMEITNTATGDLPEAFALTSGLRDETDMHYAWIDLSRPGRAPGYVVQGRFVSQGAGTDKQQANIAGGALDPMKRLPPFKAYSRYGTVLINKIYRRVALSASAPQQIPLGQMLYPAVGKEVYFSLYGHAGFVETQVLVPSETVDIYLSEFETLRTRMAPSIALATVKLFRGERSGLRYDGEGYSFTLDIANNAAGLEFLAVFDDMNCQFGCITGLLKDSRVPLEIVRRQFDTYEDFRERLCAFDPKRRFVSHLSRRLEL